MASSKDTELKRNLRRYLQKPKRLRKAKPLSVPPQTIETRYSRILQRETKRLQAQILQAIKGLASERDDERSAGLDRKLESTIQRLRRTLKPGVKEAELKHVVNTVSESNLKNMNEAMAAATGGIPIWTGTTAADRQILNAAYKENVRLIKTIPSRLLDDVESTLTEKLEQGMRVEDIRDLLQERFEISDRRADLIARDQVLKLNSQLVEQRASDQGLDRYVWSTSNDERVRPDHQLLEGKTFSWDDPPVVDQASGRREHPGGDYQCRCNALPDVASFLDALEADE